MTILQRRHGLAIRGHDYPCIKLGIYPHDLAVQTSEERGWATNQSQPTWRLSVLSETELSRRWQMPELAQASFLFGFFFIRTLDNTVSAPKAIFDLSKYAKHWPGSIFIIRLREGTQIALL